MFNGFSLRRQLLLLCFIALALAPQSGAAQDDDDHNIVIQDAKDEYLFVHGKDGSVRVTRTLGTTYLCKNYGTTIGLAEGYNDDIKIDKVSVFLDGEFSKDIHPAHDYMEDGSTFYSDVRFCNFKVPFKNKGATAEVIFEKTISSPIYLQPIYLAGDYETVSKRVHILVPDWMTVELKELNFNGWNIERSEEHKKDGTDYTYTIRNARAIKKEKNAPGASYYLPHILVMSKEARLDGVAKTYFKTVADQYGWYRHLVDSIGNDLAPVKQKALEIVAGKASDEEKVKAIYYWVQQNIRYIAFEDGIAGVKPKPANEVLSKRYGDCKGMGNLLTAMLRSLGYDARLCWLGTSDIAYNHATPSLFVDNHMIAAWMRDGKPTFLDGTEKFIRLGETAERIQGRQILVENGPGYLLETAPVARHQQNTATEQRLLHVSGKDLVGKVTHTYKGESREWMLWMLNGVKQDQRDETLRRYLCAGNAAYLISNLVTTDLSNNDSDLRISYDLLQKDAITTFGAESYIDMDNRKRFSTYKQDTAKRCAPICFPFKDHIVLDIRIAMPAGAKVKSLPEALALRNDDYGYSGSWSQKDGELSYHSESWMDKTFFLLSQVAALNKDVAAVQRFYNAQPELNF